MFIWHFFILFIIFTHWFYIHTYNLLTTANFFLFSSIIFSVTISMIHQPSFCCAIWYRFSTTIKMYLLQLWRTFKYDKVFKFRVDNRTDVEFNHGFGITEENQKWAEDTNKKIIHVDIGNMRLLNNEFSNK